VLLLNTISFAKTTVIYHYDSEIVRKEKEMVWNGRFVKVHSLQIATSWQKVWLLGSKGADIAPWKISSLGPALINVRYAYRRDPESFRTHHYGGCMLYQQYYWNCICLGRKKQESYLMHFGGQQMYSSYKLRFFNSLHQSLYKNTKIYNKMPENPPSKKAPNLHKKLNN